MFEIDTDTSFLLLTPRIIIALLPSTQAPAEGCFFAALLHQSLAPQVLHTTTLKAQDYLGR